ncbi:protein DWARF 53-LIKE-like [Dioscorea cayenensis subsp. rotundata]|uniref:Protein DWARF 53-LIKE-like n=1 Tax=Dioscorea cayennensis subsp. rotundata TaxID=55577 RepID=A0AB40D0S0_DIOCR|nr:protein DWARF 53-LIKE-like [Dioscorea cayenensis subsp. rotundata]
MPTPVGSARACVAGDAARALDEAVAVARRRAHAQTTSLHVVSALLSPSFHSPMLRDALARARSAAYSPRLQFKALELCFGVALDRLPSAHPPPAEPAVSNSLMAAIKRSQANQRRNPDTFHLYSGGAAGATSVAGVKVELQQMLMAILDDPVVSRVFGEAGFRSCDIKLAVLRPPPQILRFPRSARCPPLFLCNFDSPFPFPLSSDVGDENCRRIGETLTKSSCKNPILIGVGAAEAGRDFARAIEQKNASIVPAELRGVKLLRIENWNSGEVEEMGKGAGVVVILGDLKGLVECSTISGVVEEVTAALLAGKGRVWVMGWSATYETYMKLLSKHPCLDKDWDLQLLPITSVKNSSGGSLTRSHSLMESFVPFGGFFPLACESKYTMNSTCQPMFLRCQLCNDMYEQDVAAIAKGWSNTSKEDQRQEILPSWLRNTETDTSNKGLDFTKAKDDKALLNAKVLDLQKKWDDNCKRLHCGSQMIETDSYQLFPHIVRLQYVPDKQKLEVDKKQSSNWAHAFPITEVLEAKNLLSELQVRPTSTSEQPQTDGFQSHPVLSDMNTPDEHASPSSVTSVTTELVLGTPLEAEPASQAKAEPRSIAEVHVQSYSSCCSSDSWLKGKKKPTGCFSPDSQSEPRDFKAIFHGLVDKVGRQEEAIWAISQAILSCRLGAERLRSASQKGDIWFSFHGPDKVGKRKVALALSELMFDSRENFVSADLNCQDDIVGPNAICYIPESDVYDMNFRGKTLTDHIAVELSKKPWSVVFLENVDKADLLVQNALSQAIRTGKFSDSHGREISINNAIFITTANTVHGKECARFSEEIVLSAQRCQMKISLLDLLADAPSIMPKGNVLVISSQKESSAFITKRKLDAPDDIREHRANKTFKTFLDLNLPVEELSGTDSQCSSADENNSDSWVEEFFKSMDERVNFKPFDFDVLADNIIKEISYKFLRTIGPDYILEIDIKAMLQILAASWLLEERSALSNWIERTLCRSCNEARQCRVRNASSPSVLRLVACEDELMEHQAPGILLPSRISLT